MITLGLDVGASSSKWVLSNGGEVVARGLGAPFRGHLNSEADVELARQALAGIRAEFDRVPEAVHAGVTGLTSGTPQAEILRVLIAEVLGASRATVESDLDLAYRAHFQPSEGVLVYAGTGAIGYHVGADGRVLRAGGRGFLIGDDGGGFAIGRAALRVVTGGFDAGRVPSGLLSDAVLEMIGGQSWEAVRAYVYGGGAGAVAALVPAVGQAAERGDLEAQAILQQAGRDLAHLAATLFGATSPLPLVATGNALKVSPLIFEAMRGALPADIAVRLVHLDHAEAAARLAQMS